MFFSNEGQMVFEKADNGLNFEGFSNGAAYGDLDNDGDLDLVVNNINHVALVYENTLDGSSYVQLILKGEGMNTWAFGSKVTVYTDTGVYHAEQQPVKGYMSSMDPRVHIGLGESSVIDSLVIRWHGGKESVLRNAAINQV